LAEENRLFHGGKILNERLLGMAGRHRRMKTKHHCIGRDNSIVHGFVGSRRIGGKSASLRGEEPRLWSQSVWVQAPALILGSYMTLLSLFISLPQFSQVIYESRS